LNLAITNEESFLITARVSAQGFASNQAHCSQVANYLATFASSKHKNPERFTAALSGVLTQLLEAIFQYHERQGEVIVTISQLHHLTGIRLEFPVNYQYKLTYVNLIQELKKKDSQALYERELTRPNEAGPGPALGFLKVATQYPATLEDETIPGSNAIRLFMTIDLESAPAN
jgi:hypothetical protein